MSTLTTLIDDLVAANRILAGLDVLDGFGHVSVRHPERADCYLLSRSLAPELVTRDDIMTFDLASIAQDGDTRTPYLERFIHGEIYAQRPDVQAVVHSHAATVVPFAASSVPLKPIYHMSCFLRTGAPVFEIREKFGMTDMLIRNNAQGAALAEKLSDKSTVLMRGHGYCTVGSSIRGGGVPRVLRAAQRRPAAARDRARRRRHLPRRRGSARSTTRPTAALSVVPGRCGRRSSRRRS